MAKTKVLPNVFVGKSYHYAADGTSRIGYDLREWCYKDYSYWYWKVSDCCWARSLSKKDLFDTHSQAYNCLRRLRRRGQLGPGLIPELSEMVLW